MISKLKIINVFIYQKVPKKDINVFFLYIFLWAVVAQWVRSWFYLKTLRAKGRRFKSPSGRLIQRKFSMKRKNSMIYGPPPLHCTPDLADTFWAG